MTTDSPSAQAQATVLCLFAFVFLGFFGFVFVYLSIAMIFPQVANIHLQIMPDIPDPVEPDHHCLGYLGMIWANPHVGLGPLRKLVPELLQSENQTLAAPVEVKAA